jgi:glycerate kinase
MKILIAPDSYKGNIKSDEVCSIINNGIKKADKDAIVAYIPLADGGERTAALLTKANKGQMIQKTVTGPLGGKITAEYGLIDMGKTAVIDLASASGIEHVARNELNPMLATSYGTGELIAYALDSGVDKIIIGIGGSATVDGGIGLLSALGFNFLDASGNSAGQGGQALEKITNIDQSKADPRLANVTITTACDVTNPLLGQNGAAVVFGPQKGATAPMVNALEKGLENLANIWIKAGLTADVLHPGDGAAGGVGAALRICLGANIESGAMLVMRNTGFFEQLMDSNLVITGEGMTDGQSMGGKLCSVVAREAHKAGVPVALISGALSGDISRLLETFDYAVSISCGQITLDAMIKDSRRDLEFAAENLIRAIQITRI